MKARIILSLAAVAILFATACGNAAGSGAALSPDSGSDSGVIAGTDTAGTDTAGTDTAGIDTAGTDTAGGDSVLVDTGEPADAAAPPDVVGGADAEPSEVGEPPNDADADADEPIDWMACGAGDECVALETACCDHCNGGKVVAVAKQHLAAAKAAWAAQTCDSVACTEMACAPALATCVSAKCTVTSDPSFPGGCAGLTETECALAPTCSPLLAWQPAGACDGGGPLQPLYGGCHDADLGCGDAETCAVRVETGVAAIFSSTCLGKGWQTAGWETCCPPASAGCAAGQPAEIGKLCVRGKAGTSGELIAVGEPIQLQLTPKGCFSSSCTEVFEASCNVAATAGGYDVTGKFCLGSQGGPGVSCTADCGGGSFASCVTPAASGGAATFSAAGLSVTVEVPSTLPFGGACAGSQF